MSHTVISGSGFVFPDGGLSAAASIMSVPWSPRFANCASGNGMVSSVNLSLPVASRADVTLPGPPMRSYITAIPGGLLSRSTTSVMTTGSARSNPYESRTSTFRANARMQLRPSTDTVVPGEKLSTVAPRLFQLNDGETTRDTVSLCQSSTWVPLTPRLWGHACVVAVMIRPAYTIAKPRLLIPPLRGDGGPARQRL